MTASQMIALSIPVLGFLGVIIAQRMARAAQRERAFRDELIERVDKAEARLDSSLKRERVRDNYIHELRGAFVASGGVPPPWPEELTT